MRFTPTLRSLPLTRRTLRVLRWIALPIILFGPIARASWDIRADARVDVGSPEVSNARVAEYQKARSPFVDTLLPEGRGSTRFYEDLHGNAGMAFPEAAAIGLSATADLGGWPEAVELHERAHLVEAFLPNDVARLMARLPAPAPDEYAATNSGEHFAEMAAKAWELVLPAANFCVDGSLTDRLQTAESRVPGTAGFVVRYLHIVPAPAEGQDAELRAMAERLSAGERDEWAAMWRGVDAHRRLDGTFTPWAYGTVREYLELRRAESRISNRWIDKISGALLLPSLMIVRVAGG